MGAFGGDRLDLSAFLEGVERAAPVEAVSVLATLLGDMVGAHDVSLLIADFSGDSLIRFVQTADGSYFSGDQQHLDTVPLTGSCYERALVSQQMVVEGHGASTRLYAPVTERGEALGILELELPAAPAERTVRFIASAAHALAFVIIANRQHTDVFERGKRNVPFSLAAEIQRRLLPPAFACEGAAFTLAGWLEPTSEVGGDTFDYSVEHDELHLSISDAMGHTVNAAQLATLAVSSLRNSRRSPAPLAQQALAANKAVHDHGRDEGYVTALLLRLQLSTGQVSAINAGHPTPYLLRDGSVTPIHLEADLPLGMFADAPYREQGLALQPGDRLVLVTDGMLERNAASIDIADVLVEGVDLHPREVVRDFVCTVMGATGGVLQDDATVLCVDWYGPQRNGGHRDSTAGASQRRATLAFTRASKAPPRHRPARRRPPHQRAAVAAAPLVQLVLDPAVGQTWLAGRPAQSLQVVASAPAGATRRRC
jgi:serine phosphatase RsbU (regulator of sigma subunit)